MYYIFMDDSSDSDSEHHNCVKMNINTKRRYSLPFCKTVDYTFLCILSDCGYDALGCFIFIFASGFSTEKHRFFIFLHII